MPNYFRSPHPAMSASDPVDVMRCPGDQSHQSDAGGPPGHSVPHHGRVRDQEAGGHQVRASDWSIVSTAASHWPGHCDTSDE